MKDLIVDKNSPKINKILDRGGIFDKEYLPVVMDILDKVKTEKDKALIELTLKFDKTDLTKGFEVEKQYLKTCFDNLPESLQKSLELAKGNIMEYHRNMLEKTWMYEREDGCILGAKVTPLERVGVYVPGGKATYPSTVLMNILPAKVAGVSEVIMVTPATENRLNEVVLAAAYLAGVDRVFKIGGAQAVAALAYGTETIPKVDKIVGPGNIYVALAKKIVFGTVDIDMIAGPSEILVIADRFANPEYVAADMLSQAEHDELASSIVITDDMKLAEKVAIEVKKQLNELPKKNIAEKSLKDFGAIIVVNDLDEACKLANEIAPEHLELYVSTPFEYLNKIKNAGAIFLGEYTPEAVGDYVAGPNHTLPTNGTARFFSPLGTYDFVKRSSIISFNKNALLKVGENIVEIAKAEGLDAHANSVIKRIK
ncbi:histidinol dehydrogenase [Deferribacterales bacterium Es71-Z0220]|uniref:histidinol dehydrogenase n=1 Tax=Deferrivibrio essentukiensis TaxID=2880922 RepID=UPI001F60314B|nr:histidinol dehydrogenase [Deferrivibrio essentukiensis]MCB4204786.1 histidinol dehydrogenase [Deferrivibrio essentukiensis]